MTTRHSPLSALKAQADKVASALKAAERGAALNISNGDKLKEARQKEIVKCAIVMDDKTIILEIAWSKVRETSEAGLSEYVLGLMRETRATLQ